MVLPLGDEALLEADFGGGVLADLPEALDFAAPLDLLDLGLGPAKKSACEPGLSWFRKPAAINT